MFLREKPYIHFCAVCSAILLCCTPARVLSSETAKIILTESEQKWVATHPVVEVQAVKRSPPFLFKTDDGPAGMVIDYFSVLSKKTGINFVFKEMKESQ